MKVQPSVKKICDKCKVIRRHGRVMVICEATLATSSARADALTSGRHRDRPGSPSRFPARLPLLEGPAATPSRHHPPSPGSCRTEAGHPRTTGRGPRPVRGRDATDTCGNDKGVPRLMARLVGVDLPRDKRMEIALTYIYGIGRTRSLELLKATGISPDLRSKDLTDEDVLALRDAIDRRRPQGRR